MDLHKILEDIISRGASYCDVRIEEYSGTGIELRDGKVREIIPGKEKGVGIRVLYDGAWGFSSSNDISKISDVAGMAFKLARVNSSKKEKASLASVKVENAKIVRRPKFPPADISIEFRIDLMREMDKTLREFREMKSTTIKYGDSQSITRFLNSEGTYIEMHIPSIMAQTSFTVRKEGKIENGGFRIGGTAGFEIFDKHDPIERCTQKAKETIKLLDAKPAPGGKFPVICDQELTGVFIHEAVGHCCESDGIISKESILTGRIGKRIGSEHVTVIDDPTIRGSFGSFPYDDEGVQARRKVLIEDGILRTYILNREYAHRLGMEPNGGARAESFSTPPLVRMGNTFLSGGEHSFEELLEGIKYGIYAKGSRGGQVDIVKGTFQFNASQAYLIEHGEITHMLKGVSLSGSTLETLMNIAAAGNDFEFGDPGYCGKGQMVPVSNGGPHIRIMECVVGGAQD